jgi:hypothetical protein
VLRSRFLEVMTKAKLHKQNLIKLPDKTCDLCTQTGNWFHMASMCPHPDISAYYTVRHNVAGKELTKGIRKWETREVVDHYQLWQDRWARGPRDSTHVDVVERGKE